MVAANDSYKCTSGCHYYRVLPWDVSVQLELVSLIHVCTCVCIGPDGSASKINYIRRS